MVAECDEITGLENRRAIEDGRGNCIIWICTAIFKVRNDLINFGDLEASIFDREPRLLQQHSQFGNLLRQFLAIPSRVRPCAIIGQQERALLRFDSPNTWTTGIRYDRLPTCVYPSSPAQSIKFSSIMAGASGPATSMLRAILRICLLEWVRGFAGFSRILRMATRP